MNWTTEWDAIAARIGSLLDAGNFLMAAHSAVSSDDPYSANRTLIRSGRQVFQQITRFERQPASLILSLPEAASRRSSWTSPQQPARSSEREGHNGGRGCQLTGGGASGGNG